MHVSSIYSYAIMRQCWEEDCRKRPSFSQLSTTFTAMLSNAQNATYINLDVDELLPSYSDDAGLDEDCELTGRDLHPSVVVVGREGGDTRGYRTLEAGDDDTDCTGGYHMLEAGDDADTGGYQTLEGDDDYSTCPHVKGGEDAGAEDHQTMEVGTGVTTERYHTLEEVEDDSRIASTHVAVLDVPGETVAKPCKVVRCEGDDEV